MTDSDRYSVDPLDGPAQFADKLRSLEQRISALEGAPITGGIRVRGPGGTYDVFHVDEDGLDAPQVPFPQNFVPGAGLAYVSIAAGAGWNLVARTILPIVSHPAVRYLAGWGFSDGSTDGELRVLARQVVLGGGSGNNTILGSTTSAALGVGAAGGTARLDWLHPIPLGEDDGNLFCYLDLEAQVTSGAGDIRCYEPTMVPMNPEHGADAVGVWATTSF